MQHETVVTRFETWRTYLIEDWNFGVDFVGVLSLIYVHYDMTMYQPCDVVPCHAQSRGDSKCVRRV